MIDFRNEINNLAEECLYEFVEIRMDELQLGESWKIQLVKFVEQQYKDYPANYDYLHRFFRENDPKQLNIRQLDITALVPLLLYFPDFSPLTKEGFDKDVHKSLKSRIFDFQYVRNSMKHYTGEIQEIDKDSFIVDQMNAIFCIVWFTLICAKNCTHKGLWKELLQKGLYYQSYLRREKWFLVADMKTRDISPDIDMSEVEYLAEQGNTNAQILLGKMYFEQNRFGLDRDKSFMWFFKASKSANAEAMYYMGKCYERGIGVDYDNNKGMQWIKKSADLGYAAAQYEWGFTNWGKIDITVSEKEEMAKWFSLAAAQKYPEALWTLGLCYECGYGIELNKSEAKKLKEESAMLGYTFACRQLAEEARREKNNKEAEHWYMIAAENGDKNAVHILERYRNRGRF